MRTMLFAFALLVGACQAAPSVPMPSSADAGPSPQDAALAWWNDARVPHDAASSPDASHVSVPHDAAVAHDAAPPHDAGHASPLPTPASLLHALSARPYVEEHCAPTTFPGWAHAAQRCTYGHGLAVTVADPSAARVARWIVDAAEHIAAVAALRTRDPAHYEACLVRMAQHTETQSSRIFPLTGQISEDVVYEFRSGVAYGYGSLSRTCRTCYCRINSISREQWCDYEAGAGHGASSTCLASYGGNSGWNDAWAQHCLATHSASFEAESNDHYRAQAWLANRDLAARFPHPTTAAGADVLAALGTHYPIY